MQNLKKILDKIEKYVIKNSKNGYFYPTKKIEKALSLKRIGGGASRYVFLHKYYPKVVFKIQRYGPPRNANYSEWSTYKKLKPHQKEFLAEPIVISRYHRVMVMEYVEQKRVDFLRLKPFIKRLNRILPKAVRWDIQKINDWAERTRYIIPHNIGKHPKKGYRIFDYASWDNT